MRNKAKTMDAASDGWFAVHKVREHVYAISEPLYYQHNFSYLVVGDESALLLDAGAGTEQDITRVVEALTRKPYAVLPTHLHYDHLGGVARFREIWLADTPVLAGFKTPCGDYRIPASYTLGGNEGFRLPPLQPRRLVKPGEPLDLGGTRLEVFLAPGHTPDELVLFEPEANIMFTGDFIYPAGLYCGDLPAYAASAERLLGIVNDRTLLLGSHPDNQTPEKLPALDAADLRDLRSFFLDRFNGAATLSDKPLNRKLLRSASRYRVNDRITFLENIVWADGTPYAPQPACHKP